jgi:hypothetical protein
VTVTAEDLGTPSLAVNVTVYINVSDVNDNTPQFSLEHYTINLAENEEGMNFLNLTVRCRYLALWMIVTIYTAGLLVIVTITTMIITTIIFTIIIIIITIIFTIIIIIITTTTIITTIIIITIIPVTIIITTIITIITIIPVTIKITNTVLEPSLLSRKATDEDLGINSELRYSILTGNSEGYFTIDATTGQLSTTKSLDYENNQMFTLLVQVHDLNGNASYGESFHDNTVVLVSVKVIHRNT